MHYLGFVVVDEPTKEAVEQAMQDWHGEEWDWYRCGGRWDGYFGGDEEMNRRQTHDGFNFDDNNDSAANNSIKVADYKGDAPFFFIDDHGEWVPKTHYDRYLKNSHGDYFGEIVDTPHFEERWQRVQRECSDKWFVVVDAHN